MAVLHDRYSTPTTADFYLPLANKSRRFGSSTTRGIVSVMMEDYADLMEGFVGDEGEIAIFALYRPVL